MKFRDLNHKGMEKVFIAISHEDGSVAGVFTDRGMAEHFYGDADAYYIQEYSVDTATLADD
jgi:hypothetical protein